MQVSIIIINYNTFDITCDCIASVIEHTKNFDYEIVLVDNASPKDNPDDFLKRFPNITLVKNPENNGFAKGNNHGIKNAKGELILLLNSDTILTEDSISIAADFISNNPKTVVTTKLVYQDGVYQHNARKFRSIRNELLDLARPALYLLPYRTRAKLMLNQYFNGDFSTYCDWVSGALMMFHRDALNSLPGQILDDRFFMYAEDTLWCYQFSEAGFHSYFIADTSVIHIANASTEPEKQLKLLKTMLKHELIIMAERKGKGFYYHTFEIIFTFKEMMRYYIKQIALRLFNKRIR
ncbi:MAG: glycosyltransferase family 2 protein [Chitinophagales bacterium]|nr:glycosyltransferase family 2 protein [Chitinophagaceae bacterium]MCB9064059.1 glycosyltransferase family 2 protein [Chitinophagales bacterium]